MTDSDSAPSHHGSRQVIEIWEPTFRMKPSSQEKFVPHKVEAIIKQCMINKLSKEKKYQDAKCKEMALELCTEIKEKVKGNIENYHRYQKIISK